MSTVQLYKQERIYKSNVLIMYTVTSNEVKLKVPSSILIETIMISSILHTSVLQSLIRSTWTCYFVWSATIASDASHRLQSYIF